MGTKTLCPKCSRDIPTSPLNTWKYGEYEVKRYECKHCKSRFNVYRSAKRTFTIPKSK